MGLKRILSLLTVTVLVGTSVVGCSSSNGGDSSGNASGDKVVVDIFQFKVEAKDALEKAAKVYEEKNPNVDINIETVGGGNDNQVKNLLYLILVDHRMLKTGHLN